MNPNIFNQIKSIDDFQKKPHLRKYMRQLQMYLYGNNLESGVFILTDCLGHIKIIPVYLDYGECEAILQKIERVDMAIQAKKLPERIVYDPSICGQCPFASTCLVDITNKPAEIIIDENVEQIVSRHEELKPLAKEYDEIHEQIKTKFSTIEKVLIGDRFLIQNIPSKRTVYELPPEAEMEIDAIKKQYAKQVPIMRMSILALENHHNIKRLN